MTTGADFFNQRAAESAARSANMGDNRVNYLTIREDKEAVTVRFLEQAESLVGCDCHQSDSGGVSKGGKQIPGQWIPCCDPTNSGVPCPGCESGRSRSVRGWINLIHRNAPVLQRNEQGYAVKNAAGQYQIAGYADVIEVWARGITDFMELINKDGTFRGLMSRDFVITRHGTGFKDTKYSIEPLVIEGVSNPVAMSQADLELATTKHDIKALFTTINDYDTTAALLRNEKPAAAVPADNASAFAGAAAQPAAAPVVKNPFMDK